MRVIDNCFNNIISPKNLWLAWLKYRRGKRERPAVREFERNLEKNLVELKLDLEKGSYKHGSYQTFLVRDPKKRLIATSLARDHLVHQAIYNILYPFFDKIFSPFSFSCRNDRGTHLAVATFQKYLRQASCNARKECWALHGDIEKCFDSISHETLLDLLKKRIHCQEMLWLLKEIVASYDSGRRYLEDEKSMQRGIPLGNLTSQLFINIYLDPLDKFAKEILKIQKYVRYADDFLVVCQTRLECAETSRKLREFIRSDLSLKFPESHERINKLSRGVEVLGLRFLPTHFKIRPSTRARISKLLKKRLADFSQGGISSNALNASWQSLCGLLRYGNNFSLKSQLLNVINLYAQRNTSTI